MAEIKKVEKNEPKYPKAAIGAKIGAVGLAASIIAGCMAGCGPTVHGDMQYYRPDDDYDESYCSEVIENSNETSSEDLSLDGDVAYYESEVETNE